MRSKSSSVADYIAKNPPQTRKVLKQMRALVRAAAPRATEKISYGIPAFVFAGKNLVYIAGWRAHVSLYPVTAGVKQTLKNEIARYQAGKGTLRFSLEDRLPTSLIKKVVKVRLGEIANNGR